MATVKSAKIANWSTDGFPNGPLSKGVLAFDATTEEAYIGSGVGTADGAKLSKDAGEIKLTSKSELRDQLNALAPYNGLIGVDSKQQQENLVFSTTVGNEYKVEENTKFYKIDGAVIEVGVRDLDFSRAGQHPFEVKTITTLTAPTCSVGDYVVYENANLVDNGTFDTDTSGWTPVNNPALSVGTNGVTITYDGVTAPYIRQFITNIPGKAQIFSVGSRSSTTSQDQINIKYNSDNADITVIGTDPIILPESTSDYEIRLYCNTDTVGASATIDNISVKLADDTYRCIEEDITGEDLTTSTKYETRDYISNQYLAVQTKTGVHYEVLLNDAYASETTNEVMTKNNWSKISNGLYSKGGVVGSPIGFWQSLNKGAYHPVFNNFGAIGRTNLVENQWARWYNTDQPNSSTYDQFILGGTGRFSSISEQLFSGVPGSVDNKCYASIYLDQFRDLRTNSEKANIPQLLNECSTEAVNGSLGGYSDMVVTNTAYSYTTTNNVYKYNDTDIGVFSITHNASIGDDVQAIIGAVTIRGTVYSVEEAIIRFRTTDDLSSFILTTYFTDSVVIRVTEKLPIVSYKTSLTNKLYGDPANYITAITDKLSEGKPVLMDPALVSEEGTSLIPNGETAFQLSGTKATTLLISVLNTGTASTPVWSTTGFGLDSVNNDVTQSNTIGLGKSAIVSITSSNACGNIDTPKPVLQVGTNTVATNSNEIVNGNNLTQLLGKVGTGGSVEVKLAEDVVLNSGGVISSVPTNNTISLDNSISPAIKTLNTIATADDGELVYQVFGNELVSNAGVYDGDNGEFNQLTNGVEDDLNVASTKTVVATIGTGNYV